MAQTNFSGPLVSGDRPAGFPGGANVGFVQLTQRVTLTADNTLTQSGTIRLPRGCQIIDIVPDVTTVFNSGTTATLTAGITAGGTEYGSGVNLLGAAGRRAFTYTGAQLAAMQNIGTNRNVVITATSTGTAPTAGVVTATVEYVQVTSDD